MLKVLKEREYDPDDAETLLAAFKVSLILLPPIFKRERFSIQLLKSLSITNSCLILKIKAI
jgi:hypothetical protein